MVPHAPPTIGHPSILRSDWKTLTWLASSWSKPPDLDPCPTSSSLHRFCGATDKANPAWFWVPNQEIVTVILRPKSSNNSCRFWDQNRETWATGFEVKPEKTVATGFETKPEKTVPVVLRPNHWQTVDLDFEAQPRNPHFSSPRAQSRPHTASPDLSVARPPSTWFVLCTRSPTPTTILIAAHHATPISYTPRDKQMWFSTWYKDKSSRITEMSQISIQTSTSQWLITIKPRNWPLGFSISPLMSSLITKNTKFELQIQGHMKHS
jgi:hypothetical protein